MKFFKTEAEIITCKGHLASSNSYGTEVESYFVSYLLVTVYSEFEQRIKEILERRFSKANDQHISNFMLSEIRNKTGRIAAKDLRDMLERFGQDYIDEFRQRVDPMGQTSNTWNNIITNRHKVCHNQGTNMTMTEFERALPSAKEFLLHFAESAGLATADIQDLI